MSLLHDEPAMACYSLYGTTRLARLVQRVKDRLKSIKHKATVKTNSVKIRAATFRPEMRRAMDKCVPKGDSHCPVSLHVSP